MRLTRTLFAVLVALNASAAIGQTFVPDHERTPGVIDPGITQENIADTICVPGYTNTVRPPSSYTTRLKREQIHELRLPRTAHDYHEDHLVPLCVGGHPSDPRNLWAEPAAVQWSASAMTLREGQDIFLRPDRTKEYVRFFELR